MFMQLTLRRGRHTLALGWHATVTRATWFKPWSMHMSDTRQFMISLSRDLVLRTVYDFSGFSGLFQIPLV